MANYSMIFIHTFTMTAEYRARLGLHLPPAAATDTAATAYPDYQCTTGTAQRHIVCYCCMEPLPDRRTCPDLPPVTCELN